MLTFFEFYETLLGFVLFKLYGELGIRYPLVTATSGSDGDGKVANNPSLHPTLGGKATSVLSANLNALQVAMHQAQQGNSAADAIGDALQQTTEEENDNENTKDKKSTKAERKKQKKLMLSIDEALKGVQDDDDESANGDDEDMDEEDNVPIAAPLREALEAISDDNCNDTNNDSEIVITDPEAQKRHQLFRNLTFFISREVPRGYLELIILSFGGQVGWEGQDSPISMDDSSITHHIVDRPALLPGYSKLPKSRDYIQPQWVMDSANFNFILPIDKYGVGKTLPPHLSPWVDDKEEGYVPKYKEEIERLKNGEVLETNDETGSGGVVLGDGESDGEEAQSMSEEDEAPSNDDSSGEEEGSGESDDEEEEDDEAAASKVAKKTQTEVRLESIFAFRQILGYAQANHFLLSVHRMKKQPNLPRRSCLRKLPVCTEECSMVLLRNRPRSTICTRSAVRLRVHVKRVRMARQC